MRTFHHWTIGILMLAAPVLSKAKLGGPANLKAKIISSVHTSQKTGDAEKYSTYEYEENGNAVKEYSSSEGVVFAVSWQGISKPDLSALFGSYYKEYNEAFLKAPKQYGVKTLSMKTQQMVIRRGGRMRDQRGFVYVPSLVPHGVDVESLQ